MARGTPDYGVGDFAVAIASVDTDALKPFLKGFQPLDARGRVIFMSTFDNGNAEFLGGSNASVVNGQDRVYVGDAVAKFSMVAGQNKYHSRTMSVSSDSKYGLELAVFPEGPNIFPSILFQSGNSSGTGKDFSVRANLSTKQWQVYTPGPAWVNVGLPVQASFGDAWFRFKLVIDRQSEAYVRMITDGEQVDLSAYSPVDNAINEGRYLSSIASFDCIAVPDDIWLGYYMLTADEP